MKEQINTIREFIEAVHEGEWGGRTSRDEALTAIDALEAENLRLREAATIAAVDYEFERKRADRATAAMYDIHYAIKDAGWHPGRTNDKLTDIIRAKGKYTKELELENAVLRGDAAKLGDAVYLHPHHTILGWVNEDTLPESYPYDAMFPYSKVDGVRLFPVFGPSTKDAGVTLTLEEIEALRHTMSAAVLFHRAKSLGEVRENVLTRFDQFFEHVKDHPRPRQPDVEAVFEGLAQTIFEAINPGKTWTYQSPQVWSNYRKAAYDVREFLK